LSREVCHSVNREIGCFGYGKTQEGLRTR
jgi:hypothetical protein